LPDAHYAFEHNSTHDSHSSPVITAYITSYSTPSITFTKQRPWTTWTNGQYCPQCLRNTHDICRCVYN